MRCCDCLAKGGADERVEGRVRGEIGEGGRRLTAVWVGVFGDRYVLAAPAVLGGDGIAEIGGGGRSCVGNGERGACVGKDGDGVGAGIVGTRGVVWIMLAARIYVLDDILGVGAIIGSYGGRCTGGGRGKDGRGECNCVQIGALGCESRDSQYESIRQDTLNSSCKCNAICDGMTRIEGRGDAPTVAS